MTNPTEAGKAGVTPDQWQMCGRKKGYETLSKANRAASRNKDHYPYECPHCFCWHLATKK